MWLKLWPYLLLCVALLNGRSSGIWPFDDDDDEDLAKEDKPAEEMRNDKADTEEGSADFSITDTSPVSTDLHGGTTDLFHTDFTDFFTMTSLTPTEMTSSSSSPTASSSSSTKSTSTTATTTTTASTSKKKDAGAKKTTKPAKRGELKGNGDRRAVKTPRVLSTQPSNARPPLPTVRSQGGWRLHPNSGQKKPPPSSGVNTVLGDQSSRIFYGAELPDIADVNYGRLHSEAESLQTYIGTCQRCMVSTAGSSVCPLHLQAVRLEAWVRQLHQLLSYGCANGCCSDNRRCCINNDPRVTSVITDSLQRLRDLYYVLQSSCNKCPRDGGWSQWSSWDMCSATCGSGQRRRYRTCTSPSPSNGGQSCHGPGRESARCFPGPCLVPVDGAWSQWEAWSRCSVTCGQGSRQRIRTCRNPPPNALGKPCPGSDIQMETCNTEACCKPFNGNWSPWTPWSSCSASCGVGWRERSRSCTDPPPNACGCTCPGSDHQQTGCDAGDCCVPRDGGWSSWVPWTSCSVTCGSGTRQRVRSCNSPSPNSCGLPCPGTDRDSQPCQANNCCVDGQWGQWLPWSACSTSCRPDGQRTRLRRCDSPAPNFCGRRCEGQESETVPCGQADCCRDGQWGQWGAWGACPVTCGMGPRERRRRCDSPPPDLCGRTCPGSSVQTLTHACGPTLVTRAWSQWSSWSECSASCGRGDQSRTRTCNPRDDGCSRPCPGPDVNWRECRRSDCCGWTSWSRWSDCSASCGDSASRTRTRMCVGGGGFSCPQGCVGQPSQTEDCPVKPCRTPSSWGSWEDWCPCNCRKGKSSRRRACVSDGRPVDTALCTGTAQQDKNCDVTLQGSCPACITDCLGKERDKFYPSCRKCSEYIYCNVHGQPEVKVCQHKGTEWNGNKGRCTPAPSESCPLKAPVLSCQGRADGLYHARDRSCRHYVECRESQRYDLQCQAGLEFNMHLMDCRPGRSPTCMRPLAPSLQRLFPQRDDPAGQNSTAEGDDSDRKLDTGDGNSKSDVSDTKVAKKTSSQHKDNKESETRKPVKPKSSLDKNSAENESLSRSGEVKGQGRKAETQASTNPQPPTENDHVIGEGTSGKEGKNTLPSENAETPRCYANCQGLERGKKYPACTGCRFFLHCPTTGSSHIVRCHSNYKWDDISKRCRKRSRTCHERSFVRR